VLRLKGGDPFIFGRGGEEAEACLAAGISVEVVPGISAAVGAGAAALLPLTHRDAASVVSFVSGQCKAGPGKAGPGTAGKGGSLSDQNWAGLAGVGRTLVIYMGLASATDIADKLMADGLAPDTPLAVVENATCPDMRVERGVLAGLGDLVAEKAIKSPALIIIGAVTARGEQALAQVALEATR
jgi:uroporphyrin-III C-methyltransferase